MMTNSSNFELSREQQDQVNAAYNYWLRRESAMRSFMQAEERWAQALNEIWDNDNGNGLMRALFEKLRKK